MQRNNRKRAVLSALPYGQHAPFDVFVLAEMMVVARLQEA